LGISLRALPSGGKKVGVIRNRGPARFWGFSADKAYIFV